MSPLTPISSPVATPGAARWWFSLGGVLWLAGCGGDKPSTTTNSTGVAPSLITEVTDSAVVPAADLWAVVDGSAVYLPADGGSAQVVLPPVHDDSVPRASAVTMPASVAPASIDLFSPSGKVATVAVGEYTAGAQREVAEACDAWPVVPLRDAPTGDGAWTVALLAGTATAIPADRLGGLSATDSSRLVVEITKAASLLPLDSAGLLRRVPFGVTLAYRTRLDAGVELVVAVVERRLNMEASPKTERTVLLLEKQRGARAFSTVWRETQFATEDDLIAIDVLAIVTFNEGTPRPSVFLGEDFGDGSRVQLLQRSGAGTWSLRWSSAYTGC